MPLDYEILDVFTDSAFAGNPLAVVHGADALSTEAMQTIAREFGLSETVFVRLPADARHTAGLRIFTPARELPFAGHPTVGAAVALAGRLAGGAHLLTLEEGVGPVRVIAQGDAGGGEATFDLPRLPDVRPWGTETAMLALALGLRAQDIGFENHVPVVAGAGVDFLCVPVRGLDAAARLALDPVRYGEVVEEGPHGRLPLYVYCRESVRHDSGFHARMLSPGFGVAEDPATGSAVAGLAGAIWRFDGLADGAGAVWIEQGIEMGRPSRIRLDWEATGGAVQSARIGGSAIRVARGTLVALPSR